MSYHRRRSLDWWDELTALGVGVAAGAAAVYLARLWLQRDPLPRGDVERRPVRSGFEAGEETEEGAGGRRRG
jgi:hypothetical protein